VDNSGNITKTPMYSLLLEAGGIMYWPSIVRVTDTDCYLITYRYTNTGINVLVTRSVELNPVTGEPALQASLFAEADSYGISSRITQLDNHMMVSVSNDSTFQGHIRTFTVDPVTGDLSAYLDNNTSMTGGAAFFECSIVSVYENGGDMVLFAYQGVNQDGFLQTARIDTISGAITLLDNKEFDTIDGWIPEIQKLSHTGHFIIGYNGPSDAGWLKTFSVDTQGIISNSIDTWSMGAEEWINPSIGNPRWVPIGDLNSGVFAVFKARTINEYGTITTLTIEADLRPTPSRSLRLFAPVDALPVLTNGRPPQGGSSSGHDAKYTLDNDPDTWWQPTWWVTSKLYYDLGSLVELDAITFWLHNYNEIYAVTGTDHKKSWAVSYSDDNVTYYRLKIKDFATYHTAGSPIVVDELVVPITARYWCLEFLHFDNIPETIRPEISAMWFMNDYSMRWKHEHPERNTLLYFNNTSTAVSGTPFASPATIGQQRILERNFVFNGDAEQGARLADAYHASKGRNLPIIMQTEFDSNEYYALQFERSLKLNQTEHERHEPSILLRELGHLRVPTQDRRLTVTTDTVGLWRFRQDGLDETTNDHDFTMTGIVADDFISGILDQGPSAWSGVVGDKFEIDAGDADDFKFGTTDFTVEMWMMVSSSVTGADRSVIRHISGTTGWNITFDGAYKVGINMGDGVTFIGAVSGGDPINDDIWHLHTITIDRSANEVKFYADGVYQSTTSIAALSGDDIGISTVLRIYQLTEDDVVQRDELCISSIAMSATEILNRYTGRVDYGTWGM
jgi:hypothetical protein